MTIFPKISTELESTDKEPVFLKCKIRLNKS